MAEAGDTRPVPFRGGGFRPGTLPFAGPLTFLAVLGLWWVASHAGWVARFALPTPEEVFLALGDLVASGQLARHLTASLGRLLAGWALGASAGVAVGLAIGLFSLARSTALPLVSALFPIPKIALLPLFILWFGIGEASKVATIAFGVFSPMAIAAFGGVDAVDRTLIRMAQSFGLPARDIVRKIVLPGALPALLSGARISASIGIILLTAAEMIGAEHGVGALVLAAGNLMQTDQLVAGVLVLSGLGLIIAKGIGLLERRLLTWRG
ncbi:ABC transporter permease [Prosthecomicrobium sp. N25]|uniref:ABC transporter permease n=1 Tax=Prosthecomicrobium sp. N25 TaxID=3129254 RepID=UPI003076BEE8